MDKKEVIKACKEQRLYDFVANNYYDMTLEELKDICLEAIYNVVDDEMISEGLEDRWDCFLEEGDE